MKMKKKIFLLIIVILLLSNISISNNQHNNSNYNSYDSRAIKSSINDNNEIIEAIFNRKIDDYGELGYFPQFYEPSLHATYHALYTLDVLDRLELIDTEKFKSYILSQIQENSGLFIDLYTLRYLDMETSLVYYSLTSLLESQCYAILSLEILNSLELIDSQFFIGFIWSCFNPQGDYNGFIGRPWSSELEEDFKIATMDNTYYAVQTLDVLGVDWADYGEKVTKLIQFINSLQSISSNFGGFFNDFDMHFESLDMLFQDINPLSSVDCIKTLEKFQYLDSIRVSDFHQYLSSIYNDRTCSFDMNFE